MALSPTLRHATPPRAHVLTSRLLNWLAVHPSNYWLGFVSDPLTALALLYWNTAILRVDIYASLACYAGGLLCISLVEYALHRWIFHSNLHLAHAGHTMHHDEPKALLGFPWFLTAACWWSVAYIAVNVLEVPFVLSFIAAFVTGYSVYGFTHHLLHHRGVRSRWLRKLRIHHNIHHRIPDVNFGVTNTLWDRVFGTTFDRQAYRLRMSSAVKQG